jgi:hypothetical protein
MKKLAVFAFVLFIMAFAGSTAKADDINLSYWGFNVNGAFSDNTLPGSLTSTGFTIDPVTSIVNGLGTVSGTFSTPGTYNVIAYFDEDVISGSNTFDTNIGSVDGTPASGQSYQIGLVTYDDTGSISADPVYAAVSSGELSSTADTGIGDVDWAMGWNFVINPGDAPVVLSFNLSTSAPASGFYLQQQDNGSSDPGVYFYSTLEGGGGVPTNPTVPEPGTLILLGTGLAACFVGYKARK